MAELIDQDVWEEFFSEELDSDINLCADLMQIFREYSQEICALECEDTFTSIEKLRSHAHKLRASSAFFGAKELELYLFKLENSAKKGKLKEIIYHHDRVKDLTQKTILQLEDFLSAKKPYKEYIKNAA